MKGTILAAALAAAAAAEASLVATADRSTARYHVGETAKFVVTVTPDAEVAPTGVVKVVVYDWGDRAACGGQRRSCSGENVVNAADEAKFP